jgi:hypothetical protein
METEKKRHIFLVLVPHRDTRLILRKYSEGLFKAGFPGAFHFPWVSPLAAITNPLKREELKIFAHNIRKACRKEKFRAEGICGLAFPDTADNTVLSGARLDINLSDLKISSDFLIEKKIKSFYSPSVLGACLLSSGSEEPLPCPPEISFRAAAVANMFWQPAKQPDGAQGFKWKIGALSWLPSH